ncbi:MAG: hypothetical protein KKG09_00375 [Verrucomicrobia bacterium]|nr:hypothetical protein [Verrucomicrobiota bacterium]MCG2679648.1 hypothetical protein [Kiritimatiellia bacterium]MBU4247951.1 hypothetical protein [Verrucomicrobiota bacterium]MBU4291448.1 hypothetical protein [Verrucomicrobiota bacterium]MBU4428372.1 hypothetical protein [Verrucomicrobiota bacterium]
MTLRTFHSVSELVRAADTLADSVDTLTIDFFDTLVIRRMADPDQVKMPVARYISARAETAGIVCSWQTCLQWRADIEQEHRRKNGTRYPDFEACYPEFMGELLRRIFGDRVSDRLLQDVTDWELKLEKAMLVPRSGLADLVRRWYESGKAVWVMTDVYLPSSHVRRLADHAGLLPYLTGIVSSADGCMAKASGAGFRRLQEQQRLDVTRWAHIGDNPISDGVRPSAMGIRALVLRDASEAHRKALFCRYARAAAARPFWKGRLVQQCMLPLEYENTDHDSRAAFGYHFFGPLAGGFVQHIAARTRELGLRRIYFFSREGLMLKNAWERATPWLFPAGGAPEARYLYVSRVALAGATCARRGLTHADAPLALLPATNRDIRDVFRVFGLSLEGLRPFLDRHRLPPNAPLNPIYAGWTQDLWHRFDLLLKDDEFQEAVKQQTREQGRLVERYLEQEGLFELPAVGLVDIGWLGTIQRFLYEAIEHRSDKPKLRGLVFGATRGIPYPASDGNTIEGFIYDRDRSSVAGNTVTYALNIFEEAFRAPHAGVMGYAEQDGRGPGAQSAIQPVFQPETHPERVLELEQNACYAPLQQMIPEAVERYAAAVALLGVSVADVKPWLSHLVTMRLAFPRSDEVRQLQWKHHVDQYSGEHEPPLRIKLYLLRLWDLKPWMMRIPGLRLGFYGWTTVGLPALRRMIALWYGLRHQLGRMIHR